jgi:hypothetical protein
MEFSAASATGAAASAASGAVIAALPEMSLGASLTGAGLGVGSNGWAQYHYNTEDKNGDGSVDYRDIDKTDLLVAGATGALGPSYKLLGNVVINEGGYVVSKTLNGEDVTLAGAGATALGTTAGYGFGKYVPQFFTPYVTQTLRPGLTQINPNVSILFQMQPQKTIFNETLPNWTRPLPSYAGTTGAPNLQEFTTPVAEKLINELSSQP